MTKLSPLQMMKRAAKQNPAYKRANVYTVAQDDGATVYTAEGELQFDLAEETFGYVDRTKETLFTNAEAYTGSHVLSVLSESLPNGVAMIMLDGALYVINGLHSSDALAVSVRYDCNALSPDDPPTIRNNTL